MNIYLPAPGKYHASLPVLLGLAIGPFLTPEEFAKARTFDSLDRAFSNRMEAHSRDEAKGKAISGLERFARGESDERPDSKDDMIRRFDAIRRAIRHERRKWAASCGMREFVIPILERMVTTIERHRSRLADQEQAEAELHGIPYEASQTVLAIENQLERARGLVAYALLYTQPHTDFPTVREILHDVVPAAAWDSEESQPSAVLPDLEPMPAAAVAEAKPVCQEADQETLASFIASLSKMDRPALTRRADAVGLSTVGKSNAELREGLRAARAATLCA